MATKHEMEETLALHRADLEMERRQAALARTTRHKLMYEEMAVQTEEVCTTLERLLAQWPDQDEE